MPISLARVAQIKIGSFNWYQSQIDLLCMFKTLIKYETFICIVIGKGH